MEIRSRIESFKNKKYPPVPVKQWCENIRGTVKVEIRPDILEKENLLACRFLLLTCLSLSVLAVVVEVCVKGSVSGGVLTCFLGMLFLFAVNIAYRVFVRQNSTLFLELISFLCLALLAFADTSAHPHMPVFLFPIMLVFIPPLVLDKPWKLLLLIIGSTAVGYYFNWSTENGLTFQENIVRLTAAMFISCALTWRMAYKRIRSFEIRENTRLVAEHDPLTGVYNRGGGTMMIRNCVDRHESGTFLIIDVDDFKHVNDAFGHQRGDEVLKEVAATLRASFKETDVIMRMGGDEFMVYAIGMVDYGVVQTRLSNLRDSIHQIILDPEEEGSYVTVSMGCVINDGSYPGYDSLYRTADKYLYQVKEKGKDGFQIHDTSYRGLL